VLGIAAIVYYTNCSLSTVFGLRDVIAADVQLFRRGWQAMTVVCISPVHRRDGQSARCRCMCGCRTDEPDADLGADHAATW
jgi:hypothetical protein